MRWTYAGVRPLFDDASKSASRVTRDYRIELTHVAGASAAAVDLRRQAHDLSAPRRNRAGKTAGLARQQPALLDASRAAARAATCRARNFRRFVIDVRRRWRFLPITVARRLARAYGTRVEQIIGGARSFADLGEHYGAGLTAAEVDYLIAQRMGDDRRRHPVAAKQARPAHVGGRAASGSRQRWARGRALAPERHQLPRGIRAVAAGHRSVARRGRHQRAARRDARRQDDAAADHGRTRSPDRRAESSTASSDLTGVPVRQRNVAMVYQQFINYPSLTVYENIASPLRVARKSEAEIKTRVTQLARDAAAHANSCRAIRRSCPAASSSERRWLVRSRRMRSCCCSMSRSSISTTSCAKSCARSSRSCSPADERLSCTRRPSRWKRCSSAATRRCSPKAACCSRVRRWRCSGDRQLSTAARAFSDPPLNVIPPRRLERSEAAARRWRAAAAAQAALAADRATESCWAFARTSSRSPATTGQLALRGRVELAEISGSETFIHLARDDVRLVAQIPGVHDLPLNEPCTLYVRPGEPVRLRSRRTIAVRAGELSVARIDLEDVGHRYARRRRTSWALRPMTMTWKDGGAYALLGPSGCGKTTLLNIISGLIAPTRGRVLFDGRDVTALPPEARNIAQVFQFPVVYDTMTVFDNLAFPLRNRGWDRPRLRSACEEVAEILELSADLGRRARGAVGGPEAEDLARPRPGAPGCRRGAVRRAADRDRSAPEVAAAPQAQADPSAAQALAALRHARPDRSADVRRPGRGDEPGRDRADRHARAAVRDAGASLRRPLHRLARHELPRLRVDCRRGDDRRRARRRRAARRRRRPARRSSIGVRPEYLELASTPGAEYAFRRASPRFATRASRRWCDWKSARSLAWAKLRSSRATPLRSGTAFARLPPARCALYADERRVP